jgi:hypothetical protein
LSSIWHVAQREELRSGWRQLHAFEVGRVGHRVVATRAGVWVVSEWGEGAQLAVRAAFSPGELTIDGCTAAKDGLSLDVAMTSPLGEQETTIRVEPSDGTVSATTTLRPAARLHVEGWPRDVVADLVRGTKGSVHASQRGLRTGLVHASLTGSGAGSFMYLQDLSLLGNFCDAAQASGAGTVGGEWPDLGFALPAASGHLKRGVSVDISAWHVAFADEVPDNPVAVADQYLELLARLYLHADRPSPKYVDWRRRAEQCREDMERCEHCWLTVGDRRYLQAYVGDDKHPPESMVQLAVLLPLIERTEWCERDDPLVAELRSLTSEFWDERTGSIARWLPAVEGMLDGSEPHEHPRLMDSWYILHPLLNLARLAARGDEEARSEFLRSLDVQIRIAQHFNYDWPVFYDVDTLEVIKAESERGKGGEQDVAGLYAHVTLQAYELTDDRRYLDEAIAAANVLRGKGFEIAYQTNNVAFGMAAMARLAKITGSPEFLDISRVLAACLFDNVGLWSTRYGHARQRASFFGVFPMPNASYTAAYEQAEVAAAALEYIERVGDDLSPPLAVLLPELIRHVTARLDVYYPANLAPQALAKAPKTGRLLRDLWIPVEDVGDGWDQAGAVGQEVYGAGIAFSTVARSYVRVPERTTEVYCEYPFTVRELNRDRVVIRVHGDGRLECRLRVLTRDDQPTGLNEVIGSTSGAIEPAYERVRFCDFWIPAGQEITLTFT